MHTETQRFVASERILWIRSDGTETVISVNVSEPYQVDAVTWACPVSLDGFEEGRRKIFGASSLQALCLAIGYAHKMLSYLVERGEKLVYSENRSSFFDAKSLNAIFGRN
jgi:hypothetical protein